ncbi:hypothetical protein O6H91_09G017400 [Diphasiastrum complanatum]|uniref:Uncharacterized protein n=1 Tax=Diphasiastrum complanatum TaxID=34168 RepID=A0ACC2CLU3_DIPCM|nr:hypothetical protein O6H91_09G017400 [Diphasiastrum complanatum]
MGILEIYRALAFGGYGNFNFTRSAFLKHAKNFKEEDLQYDMTGKNCIVTGANSGIGFATAEALASRGANIVIVCRNKEKGEKALTEITSKTGNSSIHLELCDMSSVKQVKELASRFSSSQQPLHVLVNNAGLLENEHRVTAEGLELNFAVNVAGVYTITESLLPALQKAAPEARVITVSSGGMYVSSIESDLQFDKGKFDGATQYSRNKRLQVALNEKWVDLYGHRGIGFYTMHPGWSDTPGVERSLPNFRKFYEKNLRTPEEGADTVVWLAMQPNDKLKSGAFYFDRAEVTKHLPGFGTSYPPQKVDAILSQIRLLCGFSEDHTKN